MYSTGHLTLRTVIRKFFLHYHQLYVNRSNRIGFMSLTVDTSDRIHDDFNRLLFLHDHREALVLANEIPVNLKGSVGLILTKVSA